jgi:MFS family permease
MAVLNATTKIPGRLDRLPWSRFHVLLIAALGITWILDGLEVTIIGAMGGVLEDARTLHLTAGEVGLVASAYISGAVGGALLFGWLSDKYGRKRIFYATLGVYILGVAASACAWNFWSFALFRMLTGAGIGGEYSAINSAIDEMMPARLRGRLDLAINGTYWLGAALGAGATLILLDPAWFPIDIGWRLGFALGAVLALGILFLRRFVPESPRWLMTHGKLPEAEAAMTEIETRIAPAGNLPPPHGEMRINAQINAGFGAVIRLMLGAYRARAFLVLSLMAAQAFLYNALFFTYALMLVKFYGVPASKAGLYLLPLAAGNFLGPILLGRFFDTLGRRFMLAATYAASALLLAGTGYLFATSMLTATTQTICWSVIFFFASTAASAAYLTASEVFPLEMRAMAIALFYAVGTAIGGIAGPAVFGGLIGTGSRAELFQGYLFAAILMLAAAAIAARFAIAAEGRSLEDIAPPLSAVEGK